MNGKGDKDRVRNRERFADNYDRIDWSRRVDKKKRVDKVKGGDKDAKTS